MKNFNNLIDLLEFFSTEEKCHKFLKSILWSKEKVCPFCGSIHVHEYKSNFKKNRCYDCKQDFSIRKGTIFDDSKISLRKWFMCIYLINSNKKGISSCQLARQVGVTQKTAWFMLQRIREASNTNFFKQPLENIVEIDEAYFGGKEANRHMKDRIKGVKEKTAVFGLIERDTKRVKSFRVNDTKAETLYPAIAHNVQRFSHIMTDEANCYKRLNINYVHGKVNHSQGKYAFGDIHTNTIEGYWSLVKRGINGIYHWTSTKHINKYLGEFSFRYNTKDLKDNERFILFLNGVYGKLTYKQLIG